ncbi:MAG: hypothetical protein EBY80_15760 [Actinobacteria bacterium]|nr:hypothetical protein [Actinomycetota bacterium]NDA78670.1 hypothetical protein [Actinomycetota bacterium]
MLIGVAKNSILFLIMVQKAHFGQVVKIYDGLILLFLNTLVQEKLKTSLYVLEQMVVSTQVMIFQV